MGFNIKKWSLTWERPPGHNQERQQREAQEWAAWQAYVLQMQDLRSARGELDDNWMITGSYTPRGNWVWGYKQFIPPSQDNDWLNSNLHELIPQVS